MIDRRPPQKTQRYQPLPAGQTIIILTDKSQLMPKEFKEAEDSKTEISKNPTDKNQLSKNEKQASKTPVIEKDGRCQVSYSNDMLEAFLLIEPPSGGRWPSLEEAVAFIETENILDYDKNAVAGAIERHQTNPIRFARGKPAVNGKDAEFKINYELKDLHKIYIEGLVADKNGRVDYHQVKTVQTVTVGDIIAEKIMCTPGENGINVHGQMIPAVPGEDRPIKLGKNVKWDDDGLNVIATESGKPTLVNNLISVLPIHEIYGDVNFHTGNIYFDGDIVIHGNVENGFKVEADGDIVIMGYVDAAEVSAGGNLSVKGRVFGSDKGKLVCDGDFYAKEVERVTVISKGTVTVHEAIMHSRVIAEKKVEVEYGKGWIVGGSIHAGEEISARVIGSRLSTVTELEIGPVVKIKIVDLQSLGNQRNTESVSPSETVDMETISEPNLPVTPLPNSAETEATLKTKGRIRFKDVIYPGVRITSDPFKFIIQNELTFGSLTCHEGHLHLLPYR